MIHKRLKFLPSPTAEEKVANLGPTACKSRSVTLKLQWFIADLAFIMYLKFNMQSLDCSIRVYQSILAILCLTNIFTLKISVCLNVTNSNSNIRNIHFTPSLYPYFFSQNTSA